MRSTTNLIKKDSIPISTEDKIVTKKARTRDHTIRNRRRYRWGYHQYHRGQYRSTYNSYRHKHRCHRNSTSRKWDKKWLSGILQMQMQIHYTILELLSKISRYELWTRY